MKKILLFTLLLVLFTGCAKVSPNVQECVTNDPYGFFGGLWHGFIIEISLLGRLFFNDIAIYAYDNNGLAYDIGFVLGCGTLVKILDGINDAIRNS